MKKVTIPKKLLHGRKPAEEAATSQKMEEVRGNGFTWLNLQNPDRQYMEQLAKRYNLNSLNVEDCLAKFELAKLDSYDDHVFLILHFPPLSSKSPTCQSTASCPSLWERTFSSRCTRAT